ncbi:MAG TPA: EamA family transporter [Lachnospiraceae bacterium]|nr:EamA family transporter [Lachnospiraceae bacterium]
MNKELLFVMIFLLSVFISSVSQLLLKISANQSHRSGLAEYLNVRVITAYSLFFGATLITVLAYRYVPLSLGQVLESTGYVFVTLLGYFVLKEKIGGQKLVGMLVIIAGVLLFYL